MCEIWGEGRRRTRAGVRAAPQRTQRTQRTQPCSAHSPAAHATHTAPQRTQRTQRTQPHSARNAHNTRSARNARNARRSARGRGPGRPGSNKSYRFQRSALGRNMKGERISVEPRPTLKPPITSVTQWTPRYRRVTQINTMSASAAAHSR